jgi:type IV pilus assembly protein PilW
MAKPVSPDHGRPSQQRGLSILELLVAAAIGLLIVAAGSIVLASHLREGRLWLIEVRLMQDLRAATDLITRDLRRAGYWGAAEQGLWASGGSDSRSNPYTALAPESGASDAVSFRYSRDATETTASTATNSSAIACVAA